MDLILGSSIILNLGFWGNEKLLLQYTSLGIKFSKESGFNHDAHQLVLYCLKKKRFFFVRVSEIPSGFKSNFFVPSFVSPSALISNGFEEVLNELGFLAVLLLLPSLFWMEILEEHIKNRSKYLENDLVVSYNSLGVAYCEIVLVKYLATVLTDLYLRLNDIFPISLILLSIILISDAMEMTMEVLLGWQNHGLSAEAECTNARHQLEALEKGDTLDYLGIPGLHIAGSQGVLVIAICQVLLMAFFEFYEREFPVTHDNFDRPMLQFHSPLLTRSDVGDGDRFSFSVDIKVPIFK
ncbi:hypothetical protein GIB67_033751 [Kingdonia uniflora]|uniref:Uncharacterized protein n=1 Tax=Kingdonia uniflora TaxID=39325 RepID=A0A7J7P445_9MAGN|nr:hypothetical protein GIB67_033751 [Kingdonia uniflora]